MRKKNIFIVEDHPLLIELYRAIFNLNNDIMLFHTTSGLKGVNMIKEGNPDLIILDYNIPDKDGISICRELREVPQFKDIPIIGVSSSPIKGNKEERFANAGFTQVIEKPVNIGKFRALILTYLQNADSQVE